MTKKEKAFYLQKLNTLLAFMHDLLPILIFVYVFRRYGAWDPTFAWAGLAAFIFITSLFFFNLKVDRFFIGINGFLIGGAVLLRFAPENIGNFYINYLQTFLFVSLFIVGLILTYTCKEGFVGFEDVKAKAKIRRLSFYLLAGVVLAGIMSFYFNNDMITGVFVPWLLLLAFRRLLK